MSKFKVGDHVLILPGRCSAGLEKYFGHSGVLVDMESVNRFGECTWHVFVDETQHIYSMERVLMKIDPDQELIEEQRREVSA